jgi:hypothetical protein
MKDTVVIIGSHPRTREEFDFNRTDSDIWLFNEVMSNKENKWAKRADAIFQMHQEAIWRNPLNRNDPKHLEWLKSQNEIDVYMQAQYPDVPRAVRYPLEEITERFGFKYFTSSVSYALALACYKGYKRIELYGVEMETNTEYQYQREGVTLWLGVAKGLGIEIDAHIGMLVAPLYGYEGEVVIPYARFDERIAEIEPVINTLSAEYKAAGMNTEKAVAEFEREASMDAEKNLYNAVMKQLQIGERLGVVDGARQENLKYKNKADKMREASGGEFLFSRQEFEGAAKGLSEKASQLQTEFISIGTTLELTHRSVMNSAKGSPKRAVFMKQYRQILSAHLAKNNHKNIFQGAANENLNYMGWLDQHIRAAGGAKSEAAILEQMQHA